MDLQRRNQLQQAIANQSGNPSLILNDYLMGDDGAEILATTISAYHPTLQYLEIKGNNISPIGFEILCSSLMQCRTTLRSILAEWNQIGYKTNTGMSALCKLIANCSNFEKLDLKNNNIDHRSIEPLLDLIRRSTPRSLKSIDLRWNDLGETGGRALIAALQTNDTLTNLDVNNNMIRQETLMKLEQMMSLLPTSDNNNNPIINQISSTPALLQTTNHRLNTHQTIINDLYAAAPRPLATVPTAHVPLITPQEDYPAMTAQIEASEIRAKIELQQKQAMIYREKMEMQINKVIQLLKNRGLGIKEAQMRLDGLLIEQKSFKEQILDAERISNSFKENIIRLGSELTSEQTDIRRGKYNLSREGEQQIQKLVEMNDNEVIGVNDRMVKQEGYLMGVLSDRLEQKRVMRLKLLEMQEDYLKFKLDRESMEYKVTAKVVDSQRRRFEGVFKNVQQKVAEQEAEMNTLRRKNQYLNKQLSDTVVKGLQKVSKLGQEIFELQQKVKYMHDEMTKVNLEMDTKHTKLDLLNAEHREKEMTVEFLQRQINDIMNEGNVLLDLARQEQIEERKTGVHSSEMLHQRMLDLEKAIRTQEANNKMVKNQYDKLCNLLQANSQNAVYYTLVGNSVDLVNGTGLVPPM